MPKKPKAGRGKKAPRKKALSQKEQSARFVKTARAFGTDESGRDFEKAMRRLVLKKSSSAK